MAVGFSGILIRDITLIRLLILTSQTRCVRCGDKFCPPGKQLAATWLRESGQHFLSVPLPPIAVRTPLRSHPSSPVFSDSRSPRTWGLRKCIHAHVFYGRLFRSFSFRRHCARRRYRGCSTGIFSQDEFFLKILKTWTICRPYPNRTR